LKRIESLKKKLMIPLESLSGLLISAFVRSELNLVLGRIDERLDRTLPYSKIREAWKKSKGLGISNIVFEWFYSKQRKINILYSSWVLAIVHGILRKIEEKGKSFGLRIPRELKEDFSKEAVKLILLFILSALLTNIALLVLVGAFDPLAFDSIVKLGVIIVLLFEFRKGKPLKEMFQTSAFKKHFLNFFNKAIPSH